MLKMQCATLDHEMRHKLATPALKEPSFVAVVTGRVVNI